jgi:hypothetical protein
MKRFKLFTLVLAAFALLIAAPAQAALQDMWADVYTWDGRMNTDGKPVLTHVTSGITFKVLAVDTTTAETLYYPFSQAMTSLTNPVSTTNFASDTVCGDKVAFRVDPTDATNDRYVDLMVVNTVGGFTAFVENFDKYQHTIVIDQRLGIMHQGTIWFGGKSIETDTGIDFTGKTMIHDMRVEVHTVASAATISVGLLSTGTGGDDDGFLDDVLLTAAGFVADTGVITAGTSADYTAASTYGALLYKSVTGTDGTATSNIGGKTYLGYVHDGTSTGGLSYYASSTTGAGYIHYWFTKLR